MDIFKQLAILVEESIELPPEVKVAKPNISKISSMLFGVKPGPVVDKKRSKEAKFFGVSDTKSRLQDHNGKSIRLTFDNSTDSGEFEINSLTPLKIKKGSELDKKIKALYKKHKVSSSKKTNYVDVDGDLMMREIHIGQSPTESAVKLVRDAIRLIKGESVEDEETPPKD